MKMNKIIIPVAALAMGVALVGSVSSTLAWYQYSTKAQASYIGTSVGQSENLEIKDANDKWKSSLTSTDIVALATGTGTNLIPVTAGGISATSALPSDFYSGIETGVSGYGDHVATAENYLQFDLYIRYKEVKGNEPSYVAKKLNLVDLTIQSANSGLDLYKAIRVHISDGTNNYLFANAGDASANDVTIKTGANLDTDNDGFLDKEMKYDWETPQLVTYGVANSEQTATNCGKTGFTQELGTLPTTATGLKLTVRIWIEGWQTLSNVPAGNIEENAATGSAVWDAAAYVDKDFRVGMRFQAANAD